MCLDVAKCYDSDAEESNVEPEESGEVQFFWFRVGHHVVHLNFGGEAAEVVGPSSHEDVGADNRGEVLCYEYRLLATNKSPDDHAGRSDYQVEDHWFPARNGNDEALNYWSKHEATSNAEEGNSNFWSWEEPVSEDSGGNGKDTADNESNSSV